MANSEPEVESLSWDTAWPEETGRLAYEDGAKATEALIKWAEDLDTKIIAVATASSALLALVVSLVSNPSFSGAQLAFWIASFVTWLGASLSCYSAIAPKKFRHGPHPSLLADAEWLSIPVPKYRFFRLKFLGTTFQTNLHVIEEKAKGLQRALGLLALETLALTLAQLVPFF